MMRAATLKFELDDLRDNEKSVSTNCIFSLYCGEHDEALTLEDFWKYCCLFASALGFSEERISAYFGDLDKF